MYRCYRIYLVFVFLPFLSAGAASSSSSAQEPSSPAADREHAPNEPTRTWHDSKGREAEAQLVSWDDLRVTLAARGKLFSIKISDLSESDQHYLDRLSQKSVTYVSLQSGTAQTSDRPWKIIPYEQDTESEKVTIKKLHAESVHTVTETVTRDRTICEEQCYWEYYRYRGMWCRRLCKRWVPRTEQFSEQASKTVSEFIENSRFEKPDSQEVGRNRRLLTLTNLPASAGGRASKIDTVTRRQLPRNVRSATNNEDRSLTIETPAFSSEFAEPGTEQKFRVTATVDEENSNTVNLAVSIIQQVAGTNKPASEKKKLDELAEKFGDQLSVELLK